MVIVSPKLRMFDCVTTICFIRHSNIRIECNSSLIVIMLMTLIFLSIRVFKVFYVCIIEIVSRQFPDVVSRNKNTHDNNIMEYRCHKPWWSLRHDKRVSDENYDKNYRFSNIELSATCKHHMQEMTGCYCRERDS